MSIEFEVSEIITAAPEEIFSAWLNSRKHSLMTGSPANVTAKTGESFRAWDGYITGVFLELDPPRRMLLRWRTSDFKETDADSQVEVTMEAIGEGTKVTSRHSGLPDSGMVYKKGWIDFYFTPMQSYFSERS